MKRILSVLLALVMVLGMIPMVASAAETKVVFELGANGSASHYDGSEKSSYSATVDGYTLSITGGTNMYPSARDAQGNGCIKLGTSKKVGGFKFQVSADVTKVIIKVAQYKANATQVTVNGTSYSISTASNNGAYTDIEVDTTTTKTIEVATTSSGKRAMVNSIVFVVSAGSGSESTCEHTNSVITEAVAATCTTTGYTAGVYCNDCEKYIEGHEIVAVLPHTETVTDEKAATCTENGYIEYTCSVCGASRKEYPDATGHNYVDGVCSCGKELPTDLEGQYYIAAKRKEGNYWYMTSNKDGDNDRYLAVDTGLTTLPESVIDIVEAQLFELIAVDGGYVIKAGDNYLGWNTGNKGNTCVMVELDEAVVAQVEYSDAEDLEGAYYIHFTATDAERYLSLNATTGNNYFIWYKDGQAKDLYLVPISETAEICEHTNATTEGAVKPDCTTEGATGATVCPDCGVTIQANEVIPALGHNYVDGICSVCGAEKPEVPSEATITFNDKANRTEYSTTIQVWKQNGITVTNNKGSSTSNVGDFADPARFYKNSELIIEYPGMTKIVISGPSGQYTDAWVSSVAGATINNGVVTIELANPVDSYTIKLTGGQGRANSITVYTTKVCKHVWGDAVQTLAPNCAEEGQNTYTCTLCGETKTESVPALGHVIENGICSVCSGNIYPLVTALNENDNVILYNPANKVAMANTVNSSSRMNAVSAAASNGIAVQDGMGIMKVKYVEGSQTDFYLMLDGKYLNAGATGNKLYLTEEADDYAIWYLKVIDEAEGLVYLNSRNAKYNDNLQSVEYYNGSFTTYNGSGDAWKMKLYAVAAPVPVEPTIELTHVSLDPAKDALGFKAAISGDLPAGAQVGIKLSVEGGLEKTYLVDIAELKTTGVFTLRLNGIMAANGGEKKITGTPVIMIGEEAITGTPNTTSMKQTIIDVNAAWDTFNATQQAAVKELYNDYAVIMAAWLGADNKIVPPVAEAPAA